MSTIQWKSSFGVSLFFFYYYFFFRHIPSLGSLITNFSFFISFSEISVSKNFFKFLGIFPSTIPVTADKASVVFSNFLKAFNLILRYELSIRSLLYLLAKKKLFFLILSNFFFNIRTLGWLYQRFRNPCKSPQASPSCHRQQA